MEATLEAMRLGYEENLRQADEIALLREQEQQHAEEKLEVAAHEEALKRQLRERMSAVRSHEARTLAMTKRYEAEHDRSNLLSTQLAAAEKQVEALQLELRELRASRTQERSRLVAEASEAKAAVERHGDIVMSLAETRGQVNSCLTLLTSSRMLLACAALQVVHETLDVYPADSAHSFTHVPRSWRTCAQELLPLRRDIVRPPLATSNLPKRKKNTTSFRRWSQQPTN